MARTSLSRKTAFSNPNYYHTFYYLWFENVITDGAYNAHWTNNGHTPATNDIDSSLFPSLGVYSSHDITTLNQHMSWINRAGLGVLALSWWGQGSPEDLATTKVMNAAAAAGLKCCFVIDGYGGRTINSTMSDIAYIYSHYGSHPAFLKLSGISTKYGKNVAPRGVFYLYDAYTISTNAAWATALDALRNTANDGIFLLNGLIGDYSNMDPMHGDGFFTYQIKDEDGSDFAAIGTYMAANNFLWVPCVGGGYNDTRDGRSGNISANAGIRYDNMWSLGLNSQPSFIAVTSWNEWQESTSIEPSQAKQTDGGGFTYLDFNGAYGKQGTDAKFAYVDRTKYWTASERRPQVYGSRPLTVRTPLTTKRTSYTAPWSGLGINVNHSGTGSSFPAHFTLLRALGFTKVRLLVVDYTLPTTLAEWRGYVQQALDAGFDEVVYGVSAYPGGSPITATNYITYSQAVLAEAARAAAFNNPRLIYQLGNEEDEHVDGTTLTDTQLQSNLVSLSNTIRGLYPKLKLSYSVNQNHVYSWLNLANIGSFDKIGGNLYDTASNFSFFIQTLYKPLPNFSKFFITEWNSSNGYNDFNNEVTYSADIASRLQSIKNSGIAAAYVYSFIDPNNVFGMLSTDGVTYREAWQTLLASG